MASERTESVDEVPEDIEEQTRIWQVKGQNQLTRYQRTSKNKPEYGK